MPLSGRKLLHASVPLSSNVHTHVPAGQASDADAQVTIVLESPKRTSPLIHNPSSVVFRTVPGLPRPQSRGSPEEAIVRTSPSTVTAAWTQDAAAIQQQNATLTAAVRIESGSSQAHQYSCGRRSLARDKTWFGREQHQTGRPIQFTSICAPRLYLPFRKSRTCDMWASDDAACVVSSISQPSNMWKAQGYRKGAGSGLTLHTVDEPK